MPPLCVVSSWEYKKDHWWFAISEFSGFISNGIFGHLPKNALQSGTSVMKRGGNNILVHWSCFGDSWQWLYGLSCMVTDISGI